MSMDVWTRDYKFDYSYWSYDHGESQSGRHGRGAQPYASQAHVFGDLGTLVLDNAMMG